MNITNLLNTKNIIKYLIFAGIVFSLIKIIPRTPLNNNEKSILLIISITALIGLEYMLPPKEDFTEKDNTVVVMGKILNDVNINKNVVDVINERNGDFPTKLLNLTKILKNSKFSNKLLENMINEGIISNKELKILFQNNVLSKEHFEGLVKNNILKPEILKTIKDEIITQKPKENIYVISKLDKVKHDIKKISELLHKEGTENEEMIEEELRKLEKILDEEQTIENKLTVEERDISRRNIVDEERDVSRRNIVDEERDIRRNIVDEERNVRRNDVDEERDVRRRNDVDEERDVRRRNGVDEERDISRRNDVDEERDVRRNRNDRDREEDEERDVRRRNDVDEERDVRRNRNDRDREEDEERRVRRNRNDVDEERGVRRNRNDVDEERDVRRNRNDVDEERGVRRNRNDRDREEDEERGVRRNRNDRDGKEALIKSKKDILKKGKEIKKESDMKYNELPEDFLRPIGEGLGKWMDNEYTILNTDKWRVPMPRPPICISSSKPCEPCPLMTDGYHMNLKEWNNARKVTNIEINKKWANDQYDSQ